MGDAASQPLLAPAAAPHSRHPHSPTDWELGPGMVFVFWSAGGPASHISLESSSCITVRSLVTITITTSLLPHLITADDNVQCQCRGRVLTVLRLETTGDVYLLSPPPSQIWPDHQPKILEITV